MALLKLSRRNEKAFGVWREHGGSAAVSLFGTLFGVDGGGVHQPRVSSEVFSAFRKIRTPRGELCEKEVRKVSIMV